MKVLLIDDNPDYLRSMERLYRLSDIDSEILCFLDAFEALKYISTNHQQIRVVFTDYDMKKYGMSGAIIAEKCSESSVPVFICTGYDQSELKLTHKIISKLDAECMIKIAQDLPQRKIRRPF